MTSFSIKTRRTKMGIKSHQRVHKISKSENCLVNLDDYNNESSIGQKKTSSTMLNAARSLFKLFSTTTTQTPSMNNSNKIHLSNNLHRIPLAKENRFQSLEIEIENVSDQSLGLTLAGYCPCHIAKLETSSLSAQAGLMVGDLIIKVNGKNVSRAKCSSIVKIVKGLDVNGRLVFEVLRQNQEVVVINSTENAEYAHLNQVRHQKYQKRIQPKKSLRPRSVRKMTVEETIVSEAQISHMPSPIPHIPENEINFNRKYSVTDSDYRTQSYQTESNESQNKHDLPEVPDSDICHMNACEGILNLEEKFIDTMQKGVQQYSRPLRHCMLISPLEHHSLFQNIEKILAISEYQLHQLISHDDSALFDMFNTIGKLYENKLRMSSEAFDIYLTGVDKSFELLTSLSKKSEKKSYFNKFLIDSSDDVDMDLPTFLLLPLYYIVSVFKSLTLIKSKTPLDSIDFQSLASLLSGLEVHVVKAEGILARFSESGDNPFDGQEAGKVGPVSELVYAGYLRLKSEGRWLEVGTQLYKNRLCFGETEILLGNINGFDFNSRSRNEFQISYVDGNRDKIVGFQTDSLHEKLKWKCLFEGN